MPRIKKPVYITLSALLVLLLLFPVPDYVPDFSASVYSNDGRLLSATVSKQQQWCLPVTESIPEDFITCLRLYEDEYFYFHPGFNPVSMAKALIANLKHRKIVRGGSTITMQLMRMKNRHAKRNMLNKAKETISAVKYTIIKSKTSVLTEWAQIAPFGGNTIGIQAASLRYFGRNPDQLSWAEYALLAVIPNNPGNVNMHSNRLKLKQKRDFLLQKLTRKGFIHQDDLSVYLQEDIPEILQHIPQQSYHFLQFLKKEHNTDYLFKSTVDYEMQERITDIISTENKFLRLDDINNMAAIVINIETNELVAYIGNVRQNNSFHYVDIAQAPRSYGSLLKPLLYAYALENAWFLPKEMVADIPTSIGDFRPQNFDKKFRGAVRLDEMLIQSLNVPAVRVLNAVGHQGFYDFIKALDIEGLNKGADHYGLSLILGGGESTLWDLSRIYKGFAQNYSSKPYPFRQVKYLSDAKEKLPKQNLEFSASTIYSLTESMSDLTRPREEKSWDRYQTDHKVAWKTGTSYGHKDAWALGFNAKYMVGVWVGNEIGEGRHDLTGITKAAPVMFKIFNVLPESAWFGSPPSYKNREIISVCRESGKIAGPLCRFKDNKYIEGNSFKLHQCDFHQMLLLNSNNQVVTEQCADKINKADTVFVLPPYLEYYFKPGHPEYKGIPANDPDCNPKESKLKIIYPQNGLKIFLPKDSEVRKNNLIAKAYHPNKDATLYWFYDDNHVCTTSSGTPHDCIGKLSFGPHILTISDQWGNRDLVHFEIISE
ncbi:MAG: penicillin-binding protein 1C [Saprospiraceae bacterium]|nr:penicillin-binding protein 1C [Saprospiraceae bacterium]